uniref:DNA mismatch repair protein S5 domain-containing protein n=1 Tax=Meloidogyne enterolobii TaxID=390850 RepID=A0A6V7TWY5_MELEN|nr:unnamed protein product [Meloidogyne enterolobii]
MSPTIPRIIQLSQNVVDKIAAGEVVIRPVNAVKELVENSLDAGATEVNVSIRAGGLELIKIQVFFKFYQVSTESWGIRLFLKIRTPFRVDFLPVPTLYIPMALPSEKIFSRPSQELSIACCRFTTSKLREFEDLQKIQTFGFRGEALASISLVSNLIITSRTANEICASKACYKEGKLIGQIERSAGLLGTTVCVEKLFQNMPSRLAAFRQPNEEAHKIADILIRYSIHYPKISFSYRRLDGNGYDFRTSGMGLLHEKASNGLTNLEFNNSSLHFSAKICLTTPVAIFTSKAVQTRNDKIKIFHLFVNGRSVESFRLQKSFDSIFTSRDLLCPFASFSLLIDPQRVDVNIHPTKKLVYFLCEDDIIEFIGKQIEKFLNETQSRQSMQINNLNEELEEDCSKKKNKNNRKRKAGNEKEIIFEENRKNLNNLNCSSLPSSKSSSFLNVSSKVQSNSSKVAPKNKIRVDFLNRSLDEFVLTNEDLNLRPNSSVRLSLLKKVAFEEENNEGGSNIDPIEINEIERENEENIGGKTNNKVDCCIPREFSFNSLVNLRKEICQKADNKLVELFKKHLLIGFFDSENALIQSENNVFLINNNEILRQFFYQLIIFSFEILAPMINNSIRKFFNKKSVNFPITFIRRRK